MPDGYVVGAIGIAIYVLSLAFGKSNASDTDQPSSVIADANRVQDDIDRAMWEAGKHDIAKQVDIPLVPKQMVHEVRTAEQIQAEDQVDAGTALAMLDEELDVSHHSHLFDDSMEINPATGLPMVGGIGGFDMAGNPYGFNNDDLLNDSMSLHDSDDWHRSAFDD